MTPTRTERGTDVRPTTARSPGEFTPPRELVAMSAARMAGRGAIDVSPGGLALEGRVLGAASSIPSWASLGVLGVGLLIGFLVPDAERFLTPGTVLVVGAILWFRYRAEFGHAGAFRVAWADVEHVVRLPSNPDVVAVVLSRPLGGAGTPEQFFFAPSEGVESFIARLRASAPDHLTWDLASAEEAIREREAAAAEEDDGYPG